MPPPILTTLQSQLAAFQQTCDGVRADVQHALQQLDALCIAQTKTTKRIRDLESVIGAAQSDARRRNPQIEDVPAKTLVQSIASIQAAIDQLLVGASCVCSGDARRSGVGLPSIESSTRSDVNPLQSMLRLTSGTTSPDLARELGTLSSPRTEYADASVQASHPHVDSDVSLATDEQCETNPGEYHPLIYDGSPRTNIYGSVPSFPIPSNFSPPLSEHFRTRFTDSDNIARSVAYIRHSTNFVAKDRHDRPNTETCPDEHDQFPLTTLHTEPTFPASVPLPFPSSAPVGSTSDTSDTDAPTLPLKTPHAKSRHASVMRDSSTPMSDEDRRVDNQIPLQTPDMISRDMSYSPLATPTSKEDRAVRVHGESEAEDVNRVVVGGEKEVGVVDGGETLTPCLRYPSPGPGRSLFGDSVYDDEAGPTAVTSERQLPEHPTGDQTFSRPDGTIGIFSSLHSSSSSSPPTQDEAEVINTLLADSVSTSPWSRAVSPPRTSPAPAHASMSYQTQPLDVDAVPGTPPQLFTVNPSVLYVRTKISPTYSTRSLTPLTPLDDTSSDEADLTVQQESACTNAEDRSVPSPWASGRTSVERSMSASPGRIIGGPGATLNELVRLSRREPLRIRLKVPIKAHELKRKQDVREEEEESEPRWIEAATTWNAISSSAQDASERERRAADEDGRSGRPVRKKTKRQEPSKLSRTSEGSARKKVQRPADPVVRPPLRYHVRKGQLVSVESESRDASTDTRKTLESAVRAAGGAKAILTPPQARPPVQVPSSLSSRPTKKDGRTSPVKTPKSQRGATWPKRLLVFSHWDVQFVQCDDCDRWYHYGCVGITSGDPRLAPDAAFICPTCHVPGSKHAVSSQDGTCARSDCPEPQVTENTELYFVEKLVGRKKVHGHVYVWLAKWEGYPMSDATWIPEENVVGDGTMMFDAFVQEAKAERADLAREVVLLKEAVDAGWDAR